MAHSPTVLRLRVPVNGSLSISCKDLSMAKKDEHRLMVHGLTFLRDMDRELDSRN
jgi:hypothetical protein